MRYFLSAFILLSCTLGFSQDVHFSMFDMSPLTLNPAHTGVMNGDRRLCNIYRTQWKAIDKPLQTFALSYDQQLYFLPKNVSLGLVFVSDKSGGIDLIENRFVLSTAIKLFRGINTISIGLQGGYSTKTLSLTGVTFPQQYSRETGQFDPNLLNGESGYKLSKGYFDINAGILWTRPTKRGSLTAGAAVIHANNPDDSFYSNGFGLQPKLVLHGKTTIRLNDKWFLRPSALLMTLNKAQDLLVTTQAGIRVSENNYNINNIFFGIGVRTGISRNGDAAIPTAGIEFKHFDFAAAYDINFSDLKVATNNRGAFEIAIIYNSRSTAINKITVPCDRY